MGFIDIIVIAVILVLVITRFTGFKLPTDLRDKATRKADFDALIGKRKSAREAYPVPSLEEGVATPEAPVRRKLTGRDVAHLPGIEQIKTLDASFDEARFVEGTAAAYAYFYECYNARDREGIINLCGPELETRILAEWETNPAKITPEGTPTLTLTNARLNGRTAVIDVVMMGALREGKAAPKETRATWVFARAVNSPDPNWELQSITPLADA